MLLHCEATGTGGECKQPCRAGAPSTSENVSEGLGLRKSATPLGLAALRARSSTVSAHRREATACQVQYLREKLGRGNVRNYLSIF